MTMIGRVIDGLPLAASMQSDQDVSLVDKRLSLCLKHRSPVLNYTFTDVRDSF